MDFAVIVSYFLEIPSLHWSSFIFSLVNDRRQYGSSRYLLMYSFILLFIHLRIFMEYLFCFVHWAFLLFFLYLWNIHCVSSTRVLLACFFLPLLIIPNLQDVRKVQMEISKEWLPGQKGSFWVVRSPVRDFLAPLA